MLEPSLTTSTSSTARTTMPTNAATVTSTVKALSSPYRVDMDALKSGPPSPPFCRSTFVPLRH